MNQLVVPLCCGSSYSDEIITKEGADCEGYDSDVAHIVWQSLMVMLWLHHLYPSQY